MTDRVPASPEPVPPPSSAPAPAPIEAVDAGQRTHPLSPLVSSWIAVVAVAFFVGRDIVEQGNVRGFQDLTSLVIYGGIGGVVLVGSVVMSALSWYLTRYRLDPDGLTIESRLIVHETKRMLYRRIQSVEINQPLAARFLGLCRLSIDVGGDGSSKLSFLTRQQAENLRYELLQRSVEAKRDAATEPRQAWPDTTPSPMAPAPAVALPGQPSAVHIAGVRERIGHGIMHGGDELAQFERPRHLVVQVTPKSLVIAALTSGEFLGTLVGFGIFALIRQLSNGAINFGFGLFLLLPLGGYVLTRVIKEWRFRVETDGQGLRISHGMTDLSTSSTPFDRVQGFTIEQGVLWRRFGWWRVRMTVLGKGSAMDDDDSTNDVALAVGTWVEAMAVVNTVWPGVNLQDIPLNPVPERAKWFLWWGRRTAGWAMTDELAVSRRGWLGREFNVIDHARAQSLRLHQGPLDRRLDLASVSIALVDGPVGMHFSHLNPADARRVLDQQPGLARAARERRASTGVSLSTRPFQDHHGDDDQPAPPGPSAGPAPSAVRFGAALS